MLEVEDIAVQRATSVKDSKSCCIDGCVIVHLYQ